MSIRDVLLQPDNLKAANPASISLDDRIAQALRTVRLYLGMDVAFVSEFSNDHRVLRQVDSPLANPPIRTGDRLSMQDGYCRRVVEGKLPQLIPDTSKVAEAVSIPDTHSIPIGAHISVPIRLADGRVYGTFCCFSLRADASLNDRDLQMMRAVADLVAHQIDIDAREMRDISDKKKRVQAVLDSGGPTIVYQPVFRLSDGKPVGAEALSRFALDPYQTPDKWFAAAADVGLGPALELLAAKKAIEGYAPLWSHDDIHLAVNIASTTVLEGSDLADLMTDVPCDRIVLEITEHDRIEDYDQLARKLVPLRMRGVKIAVDDAGSGYASLRHILRLKPDIIKLDVSLTRDVNSDHMRSALAAALMEFARQVDCTVVAEGIETEAELEALKKLGVHLGQGFLLGRPGPLDALEALFNIA